MPVILNMIGLRVGSGGRYYVKDSLGSVIGMIYTSGAYEGGYSYEPNGESRAVGTNSAVIASTQRYIASQQDADG